MIPGRLAPCVLHLAAVTVVAAPGLSAVQVQDRDGLRELGAAWTAAYEAGDAASMEALYTDDAVRMPYDVPAVEGRRAIVDSYAEQFAGRALHPQIELTSVDATIIDDLAIERGRYEETWLSATGSVVMEEQGKFVSVSRRGADGRWRYQLSIFNRDAAPSSPQAHGPDVATIRPDQLDWNVASSGGAEIAFSRVLHDSREPGPFVFRMRVPAGWTMQPHAHDGVENLTVLSGAIEMSFSRNGERVPLPAGSFVSIPAGTPMWAWSGDSPAVIQVHGAGPFRTVPVE